jgi:hypothetical protein
VTLLIDALLPEPDGRLLHQVNVACRASVVRAALERITFADLPTLGLLVRVRTLGRRTDREPEPIFAGMRDADYVYLVEEENEIAAAMAGPLWNLRNPFRPLPNRAAVEQPDPAWALTLSSYRIDGGEGVTRFTCETRVKNPVDRSAARRFRLYWPTVGRIGATVYSRNLVHAVRRLAESAPP